MQTFNTNSIYDRDTLNIFSDASTQYTSACYGAVAVNGDNIVDEYYRLNSDTTVPAAELRGMRCSLELALRNRYRFRNINIFIAIRCSIFKNWVIIK